MNVHKKSRNANRQKLYSLLKNASFGKAFACLALLLFMALMLANPTYYLKSAQKGLILFSSSVLPSLFPFYFCSLLLTYMGAVKGISQLGKRPMRFLYNTPKESAYIFLLSVMCGYPVGASTCAELYSQDILTTDDVKAISAFASTSGPVFMLATVGGAIFSNNAVGVVILTAHYLSAILNGLIYRKKGRQECQQQRCFNVDVDNVLSQTIAKSTINMLYVGGYIVICGMLIDTLELVGVRSLLISHFGDNAQIVLSIIYGLIEMTRGAIECAQCSNLQISVAVCAFVITFGGLSITLQNYTFLSKCKMRIGQILLRKISQCIIAGIIAFLLSFAIK